MSPNDDAPQDVASLTPTVRYAEERPHLFPSAESIRWFQRVHKHELIESGALLMVAGRWMADPRRFDAKVIEIGRRLARRAG